MWCYLVVFLFLLFLFYWYDVVGNKKYLDVGYWSVCCVLIILAGIRYRVGGDTLSYYDNYSSFPTLKEFFFTDFSLYPYEPLFYFIAACAKYIHSDFCIFQCIHACIVNVIIFRIIAKYVKYRFAAVILYYLLMYFYFNMEILRESLSVCVFLLAIKFLFNRNFVCYYLIVTMALWIHTSAFFLYFLPVLYFFIRKGFVSVITLFILISCLFTYMINNPFILFYLPTKISLKFIGYVSLGPMDVKGAVLNYVHILALLLIFNVSKKNSLSDNKFLPFIMMNILIYACTFFITGIYRLANYFVLFEILVLVDSCSFLVEKLRYKQVSCLKIVCSVFILLALKIQHDTINTSEWASNTRFYNLYIPYETVFDKIQHKNRENIYYLQLRDIHLKKENAND